MSNDAETADSSSTGSGTGNGTTGPAGMQAALPSITSIDPKRLLWLGGLVTVGVLGVVEWPVVAVVGVGSYVAEQFAKSDRRSPQATAGSQPPSAV